MASGNIRYLGILPLRGCYHPRELPTCRSRDGTVDCDLGVCVYRDNHRVSVDAAAERGRRIVFVVGRYPVQTGRFRREAESKEESAEHSSPFGEYQ
ncbi:MAG: hypothetical protein Q8P56_02415 [Candidatus Uhrbacteria bacterium]|nr:hypothetical protein [Candidatus Uhrbacteria bacterium]